MYFKNKFIYRIKDQIFKYFLFIFNKNANLFKLILFIIITCLHMYNLSYYICYIFGYYLYYLIFFHTSIHTSCITFFSGYIIDQLNILSYQITGTIGDILYILIHNTYGVILLPIVIWCIFNIINYNKRQPKMNLLSKNTKKDTYNNYESQLIDLCKQYSLNIQYSHNIKYKNYIAYIFKCINDKNELTILPLRFKALAYDFEKAIFNSFNNKIRHIFNYDECIIEINQNNITCFSEITYQSHKYLFYTNKSFLIDARQNIVVYGDILYSMLFSLVLTAPGAIIYLFNYMLKYELELFKPKYILCLSEIIKEMEYRYISIYQYATSIEEYRLNSHKIFEYKQYNNIYLFMNEPVESSDLHFIIHNGPSVGIYTILFNKDYNNILLKIRSDNIYDGFISKNEYRQYVSIPVFNIDDMYKILKNNL